MFSCSHLDKLFLSNNSTCCTLVKLFIALPMDSIRKHRTIIFYKDYFEDFFLKQPKKVKAKIIWTFELIEEIERVPNTYLKHIESTNGLYEIRVKFGRNIFRIFCFFDKGKLIVLANGFQKKTKRTPRDEINIALKIREEYYNETKY